MSRRRGSGRLQVQVWPAFRKRAENPYSFLFANALAAEDCDVVEFSPVQAIRHRPDIIHIHWPEFAIRPVYRPLSHLGANLILGGLWLARKRGSKIVWTAHNVSPRGEDPYLTRFMRRFSSVVDGVVVLSAGSLAAIDARYPLLRSRPKVVLPHPIYGDEYQQTEKALARNSLGIPEDVCLILSPGQMRQDKRQVRLVRLLLGLPCSERFVIMVAGPPTDPSVARDLNEIALIDPRLRVRAELLDNDALALALSASDCIAGSMNPGNSGTALLALSVGRPLLTPKHPEVLELAKLAGTGWFEFYDESPDCDNLHNIERWVAPNIESLDGLRWDEVGTKAIRFYRELI